MQETGDKKVEALRNLGPKSQQWLNAIGVFTRDELEEMGAVVCYAKLLDSGVTTANMNLLYALVGALEDIPWQEVSRHKRALELELGMLKEL